MKLDAVVSYAELPELLALGSLDARTKFKRLQLIEVEPGRFKLTSGEFVWSPRVRAYIERSGNIESSVFAADRGFVLPIAKGAHL